MTGQAAAIVLFDLSGASGTYLALAGEDLLTATAVEPPARADAADHLLVALQYVKAGARRTDCAGYRRAAPPMTGAAVESLIQQFNRRVKGTEKPWSEGRTEAALQVGAAYRSEDDRARRFHEHRRRGRSAGRNRRLRVA